MCKKSNILLLFIEPILLLPKFYKFFFNKCQMLLKFNCNFSRGCINLANNTKQGQAYNTYIQYKFPSSKMFFKGNEKLTFS